MLPENVLLKIAKNAIRLPKKANPSLAHWKTCQLPLIQVSSEWRKALIPVVGNEAHLVFKEQDNYITDEHARLTAVRTLAVEGNTAILPQDIAAVKPSRLVVNLVANNGMIAPLKALVGKVKDHRYIFSEVKELYIEIDTSNAKFKTKTMFANTKVAESLARKMEKLLPKVKKLVVRTYGNDRDAWAFVRTLAEEKMEIIDSFQFEINNSIPFSGWWFLAKALYSKL
ncbi:hypothetical protein H4S06_006652 [Coemansia sp. BCRC 34490]|nr:hypothetical protein H4S06_006652 [Coemansia sp. BCRC 34490]